MSNTDTIILPHPPDPDANKAILDLEMKISEKLGLRVLSLSQCYHNVMLITKVTNNLAWIGPPLPSPMEGQALKEGNSSD